jgi:hypothetical protein
MMCRLPARRNAVVFVALLARLLGLIFLPAFPMGVCHAGDGDAQFDAGLLLQVADNVEEITRLRVPARAEHADQDLGLHADRAPEVLETDGRPDVVPEKSLADVNVAGEHQVNAALPWPQCAR